MRSNVGRAWSYFLGIDWMVVVFYFWVTGWSRLNLCMSDLLRLRFKPLSHYKWLTAANRPLIIMESERLLETSVYVSDSDPWRPGGRWLTQQSWEFFKFMQMKRDFLERQPMRAPVEFTWSSPVVFVLYIPTLSLQQVATQSDRQLQSRC